MNVGIAGKGYTAVLLVAIISAFIVSQPVEAGGDDWCSDLRVTVRVGKKWDYFKQQMIISTSASSGRKAQEYKRPDAFIHIKIEYTYSSSGSPGSSGGEGDAQIQIHAPWGSFSQAQEVSSPGPVTDVRVRNAYCLPVTHGGY